MLVKAMSYTKKNRMTEEKDEELPKKEEEFPKK